MNQSPTIHVPAKKTDEVDWASPLKRYIQTTYQEDPEKYADEANSIHRLRQDMRGAGKDITGRDLLYRYYGQLELLDLRFPVDENNIKISFTWYDAFTHKTTSQYSLAYEKASTIFNIASVLSAIATSQNRSEPEGLKRAFNFFQASAGMYNYINDNFLHAPSTDLSRDTVKLLSQLMLTQAQECFLEQSLGAKNKPALIAKIAAQVGWSYGNIVENMSDLISRSVFDRSWQTVCQIKHKYFASISQYQKSLACEAEVKYGECVGRLNIAETLAKEANKLSNSFVSAFSPNTTQTLPPDAATSLQDLTKSNFALITEKKNSATRDNDIVYHDVVPQENVISPIDKLILAKPIPIQDLYLPNEIQRVIGPDIFQRLIPLSVHESASLYSEEKAKIVRSETERCDLANGEMEAALEYMKLPGALSKFRNNDLRSFNELATPTSEVKQWAKLIKDEEQKGTIKDLLMTLNSLKGRSKEVLDQISQLLDTEQREYEAMKTKYGDSWNQGSPSPHTTIFHQDLLSHLDALEKANNSDRDVFQRFDLAMSDITMLRDSENSDELEKIFAEALSSSNIREVGSSSSSVGESLLDVGAPQAESETSFKVNKIDECLSNLYKVRKERMDTLNDLKDKTHQDDISHLLILNKKTQNIEPQLFATELEKFSPYRNRITASIHHQQALLQELTVLYKSLMEGEEARMLQERWDLIERKRKDVCERFRKAKDSYMEVKDGLRKGINFYIDLTDLIENLEKTVQKFVKSREQERFELAQSIQVQVQQRLKDQLNKLNTSSTVSSNAGNNLYDPTHLTEEISKLSLNSGVQGTSTYAGSINREVNTNNSSTIQSAHTVSSALPYAHMRQDSYPSALAQSYGSPSAPPRPSAPESPTSYYAAPSPQRPPSQIPLQPSSQPLSAYSAQPVPPPKTQAPPLPPLPTGYNQQSNAYAPFQPHQQPPIQAPATQISQSQPYNGQFQPQLPPTQQNHHIIQSPNQPIQHSQQQPQQSYSRPSSLYGTLPLSPTQPSAQPSHTQANFRYSQPVPQQQVPPAQRKSTYDSHIPPHLPGSYASLPPVQQQSTYDSHTTSPLPGAYASLPSVPQQYQAPSQQQYPLGTPTHAQRPHPQVLPPQQSPTQFQTNSVPSQVPLQHYHHQLNQPIPSQQGYYQPTAASQNNPGFQTNYVQAIVPQKPTPPNYDNRSLLD
ncbi:8046_t:CDS:2 [Acaulospora morrowiae]|uniref:BRO domain-containing protein 1 n=1 Tax=Acaulospora morrowiae TaxID=94023 RepID=A0A9N9DBM9_9GLOM|nr:8046_t:CDS:2 [Acaulospora morrowiae]